jgi:O-antigen/teichoic acid export membrane protein
MQGQKSQFEYYIFTTFINTGRPILILFSLLFFEISINHVLTIFVFYSYFEFILFFYLRHIKTNKSLKEFQPETVNERNLFLFLLGSGLLSVIATNIDKIMVFYTSSTQLAANYTFAASISGLLYIFINAAIVSFTPQFRELKIKKDYKLMRKNLYFISFLNNLFILASIIIFVTFIDYVLPYISDELDQESITYTFLLLSLACLISSNLWIPSIISISFERASFSFFTNMIFILLYIITYINLPEKYGDYTFSLSMIVSSLITTLAGFTYFSKFIFETNVMRFILIVLVLPFLIMGLIALPLWLIDSLYGSVYASASYVLLIAAIAGKLWKKLASTVRLGFHRYRIFNEIS